jgi:hypothetical protein
MDPMEQWQGSWIVLEVLTSRLAGSVHGFYAFPRDCKNITTKQAHTELWMTLKQADLSTQNRAVN